jgi:GH15 family glucan-1,4-alpha-glucosidase
MPRGPRLDAPGTLHHVILRGIERGDIVCEQDAYFKELVRYIHLNPLRARIAASISELERHLWCGHSAIMGIRGHGWQDAEHDSVWRLFAGPKGFQKGI